MQRFESLMLAVGKAGSVYSADTNKAFGAAEHMLHQVTANLQAAVAYLISETCKIQKTVVKGWKVKSLQLTSYKRVRLEQEGTLKSLSSACIVCVLVLLLYLARAANPETSEHIHLH